MLGKDWLSGQSDIVARTENLAKHMGLVLVALVGGEDGGGIGGGWGGGGGSGGGWCKDGCVVEICFEFWENPIVG